MVLMCQKPCQSIIPLPQPLLFNHISTEGQILREDGSRVGERGSEGCEGLLVQLGRVHGVHHPEWECTLVSKNTKMQVGMCVASSCVMCTVGAMRKCMGAV